MSTYRLLACLLLLALAAPVLADTALNPLAQALPITSSPQLGLGLDRLQWGPTAISYSQSWSAGESHSLGLLTRDLRIPLGAQLDFNARFGLAFSPGAQQLSSEEGGPRFVLPYAALDWRPGESFILHLEVGQGGGLYDPFAPYGWRSGGLLSPPRERTPAGGD
jgi:hypothetical protein